MASQHLNFPSKSENISLVEKLIDEVCAKYSVNEDHYGNILVAVTEAVNNALYHGNKLNPDKLVDISFVPKDPNTLVFTITDQGEGFDIAALPDPTNPENLEKISGRGVFLMKSLSDDITFNNDGRSVEMQFKLN
ncbi:MAG: ATP-binding protein [Bacteroidia bacterium]|nr:ATP-binding protein [Bacteroidia bacterium]